MPRSSTMTLDPVVVLGAGAAGLSAAHALADTHAVVVLDKGCGVGGRMATRRLDGATFDHGAQFVTTHHPEFAEVVEGWVEADVARDWYRGQVGASGVDGADGHTRFRGTVSMNAVAKHLASGIDVRTGARVEAISVDQDGWRLTLADSAGPSGVEPGGLQCRGLVLTAPVPQTLELLAAGGVTLEPLDARALGRIEYAPCLAVMAVLDEPAGLPSPGAVAPTEGPLDWIADNQAKGISAVPALTVHVGAQASRSWWDDTDESVVSGALDAARAATGLPLGMRSWSVQRWRYARPVVMHPEPCWVAPGLPPLVLCGDAFYEAKVEGAVRSGLAAAAALRSRLAS